VAPLSDLVKQLPELSSKAVHPKTKFSMDLPGITDAWLKSAGDIKHVVIFGIESHVCVLQTTLDLLERGIQVHVIKDGVSSCNVGEIDVALEVSLPRTCFSPSARSHADSSILLTLRSACATRAQRSPPPSRCSSRCSVSPLFPAPAHMSTKLTISSVSLPQSTHRIPSSRPSRASL
jgi:hypothetical protein